MADRYEKVFSVIQAEMPKPYKPGTNDCFFMALKCADALTSSKLVKEYKGSYRTIPGAFRALKKRGYETIADLLASHLVRVAPLQLNLGDIAVVERGGQQHTAICVGPNLVAKIETGQALFGLNEVIAGFRVD